MALNADVSFTWVGHGTWKARSAKGKEILIDPWVMNNPVAPENLKTVERCDLMLITHGHFDHIHDALEIARRTKPTIVCNHEIGVWLGSKGLDGEKIIGGNTGGTIEAEGIAVTLVHAEHSCGITDNGGIVYGGEACGLVIEFENGFSVYFAGDTDVFGDMSLIAELSSSTSLSFRSGASTPWGRIAPPRRPSCWASKRSCRCTSARFPSSRGIRASSRSWSGGVSKFSISSPETSSSG